MVGEDIRNSWEGKKEWRLMGRQGREEQREQRAVRVIKIEKRGNI